MKTLSYFSELASDNIEWELIVVDNHSTDSTAEVLDKAKATLPLRHLFEAKLGKNYALNSALKVPPKGRLVVFTDDDVAPCQDWLRQYLRAEKKFPQCGIFGGPVSLSYPSNTAEWIRDFIHSEGPPHRGLYARFEPSIESGPVPATLRPVGPNFAVRKDLLKARLYNTSIGPRGRDYAMGSETEFITRLIKEGIRVGFVKDAKVKHFIKQEEIEIADILKRYYRSGRGSARLLLINGELDHEKFIAGAPRYIWFSLAKAYLKYLASLLKGRQARLSATAKLNKTRGALFEFRRSFDNEETVKSHADD